MSVCVWRFIQNKLVYTFDRMQNIFTHRPPHPLTPQKKKKKKKKKTVLGHLLKWQLHGKHHIRNAISRYQNVVGCPNRPDSQMWATLGGLREPAGSYDKTTRTAICFEHKTQYLLIRAPYTRIVVFWHISNIPLMVSQGQISCNTPRFV